MLIFATFFTCVAAATVLVRKEKMEPGKLAHVAMDDVGSLLSLTQDQLPKKDRDGLEDDDDDEYEMEKDEQEPEEEERFIEQEIGKQGKGEGKQGKGLVQGVKDQCETCGLVGAWADAHKAAQKALADAQKAAQKALADAHKAAQKAAQKAAKTAPKTSPKAAPKTAPKGTPKAEPKAAPKAGEKGGQSLTAKKAKSGQLQAMDSRRLADSRRRKANKDKDKDEGEDKDKDEGENKDKDKDEGENKGCINPAFDDEGSFNCECLKTGMEKCGDDDYECLHDLMCTSENLGICQEWKDGEFGDCASRSSATSLIARRGVAKTSAMANMSADMDLSLTGKCTG